MRLAGCPGPVICIGEDVKMDAAAVFSVTHLSNSTRAVAMDDDAGENVGCRDYLESDLCHPRVSRSRISPLHFLFFDFDHLFRISKACTENSIDTCAGILVTQTMVEQNEATFKVSLAPFIRSRPPRVRLLSILTQNCSMM